MANVLPQSSIHNNNVVKDRDTEIKCKVKPSIVGFNEIRPMFEMSSGIMAKMEKNGGCSQKNGKVCRKAKENIHLITCPPITLFKFF